MPLAMMLQVWFPLILLAAVTILASREVWLWYFQIRRAVRALESIAESLECMPAVQDMRRVQAARKRATR